MLSKIKCGKFNIKFNRTIIIGVLNVTPDSFSDGGLYINKEMAVNRAIEMVSEGADIIDIGGESSRPGSKSISISEELERVLAVIEILSKKINVPISIDTYKPEVAEECLKLSACIINDITGLRNKKMIHVAKKYNAPVIIMHMQGYPKTMQKAPKYKNIIMEINEFFKGQISLAEKNGVKDIIIDPGIGFGKTTEHNLEILRNLREFKKQGKPILIGTSRKSFLGNITGMTVNERLGATLASVIISVMNGANIVRVHDVKECKRALSVVDAVMDKG